MAGQRLKRPIVFLNNNQCPKCYSKLELLETETYVAAIDAKGAPIGGDTFVDAILRCPKCGEEYAATKKGIYYYIKPDVPEIHPIFKEFNPFYNN